MQSKHKCFVLERRYCKKYSQRCQPRSLSSRKRDSKNLFSRSSTTSWTEIYCIKYFQLYLTQALDFHIIRYFRPQVNRKRNCPCQILYWTIHPMPLWTSHIITIGTQKRGRLWRTNATRWFTVLVLCWRQFQNWFNYRQEWWFNYFLLLYRVCRC